MILFLILFVILLVILTRWIMKNSIGADIVDFIFFFIGFFISVLISSMVCLILSCVLHYAVGIKTVEVIERQPIYSLGNTNNFTIGITTGGENVSYWYNEKIDEDTYKLNNTYCNKIKLSDEEEPCIKTIYIKDETEWLKWIDISYKEMKDKYIVVPRDYVSQEYEGGVR